MNFRHLYIPQRDQGGLDGQHTKVQYCVAPSIKAYGVLAAPHPTSDAQVLAHSGPPTILPPQWFQWGCWWRVLKAQMIYKELNWWYSTACRWWWALATTIRICSYSSWTKFMSLIDSIWKLLMWPEIICLTCKKTCSANIAHHIDLLLTRRPVNGINTYQDMFVQKHLKSFHWGTGKQTIPRYWHTAHLYRLQETPHIHLHLFPNKMWIKVITSTLNMNKSEKIRTF